LGKEREPQIILKTDQRTILLELGLGGKFQAKSSDWDENRVFVEGHKPEVAVKNGRWVLTHLPAGPRPSSRFVAERENTRAMELSRHAARLHVAGIAIARA
jgi:hypothetical protein